MKIKVVFSLMVTLFIYFLPGLIFAQEANNKKIDLTQDFNLAGERTSRIQYYIIESNFANIELNGKHAGFTVYKLYLKCIPSKLTGKDGDEYTCTKFSVNTNDTAEAEVPALKNWSYIFKTASGGMDEKGQVLGIDHAKFENLIDSNGKRIPQEKSYMIYNTFIDFHSFCNVFAEKTNDGKGIQDLKKIGEKIVHVSAYSRPPVNLGSNISEGSYFKNGEVTLLFKGISLVNNDDCALVGFDSGVSSFYIKMQPTQDISIETNGGSHYKGDIYIDLNSYWVRKVIMDEFVVAETKLPFPPNVVNSITERNTVIQNVSKEEFNKK